MSGKSKADANLIYEAALNLTKAERQTLARRMLESMEVKDKKSHGVDLRALMGMGKGLWGSAEEIDKFILQERNSWDG